MNASYGIRSWLLTTDHKRIALLYLASITFFFFVGGSAAVLMRLNLITPQGALVEPETYNKLFSMHGIIMVFLFLIPSIPAVLGKLPGAHDDRSPRFGFPQNQPFELVRFHGRRLVHTMYAVIAGGVNTGWTFYTPLSTMYANTNVMPPPWACSLPGSPRF